ncbi:Hypothetical predicted protein, partial [Marmota monax]
VLSGRIPGKGPNPSLNRKIGFIHPFLPPKSLVPGREGKSAGLSTSAVEGCAYGE